MRCMECFECVDGSRSSRCKHVAGCTPSGDDGADDCVCTEEFDPVCCKGVTYSNQCKATCDGARRCSAGECDAACVPDDACMCTREFMPVCCDGKTYSNQCLADCECPKRCRSGECKM